MGGCYDTSYNYNNYSRPAEPPTPSWVSRFNQGVKAYFAGGEVSDLVDAYNAFMESKESGFIKKLASHLKVSEIPKEFPEIEYEVKFHIDPIKGKSALKEEPGLDVYLDALSLPATKNARYLTDPVHTLSEGVNHFFGKDTEEMLVVIEKGGKLYLKEKSQPLAINCHVPYKEILVKRTENRYEAPMEKCLEAAAKTGFAGGMYKGHLKKEKADDFVLDTLDGRIYSYTVTRAKRNGTAEVQRQLELEYAGYLPGFSEFEKGEEAITRGMVNLAKHVQMLHGNARLARGWTMDLAITHERKYDFVSENRTSNLISMQAKDLDEGIIARFQRLELE